MKNSNLFLKIWHNQMISLDNTVIINFFKKLILN
jgi:hypothetical protein